jgi:hypothetical protein
VRRHGRSTVVRYPAGAMGKREQLLQEIESQWPTHVRRGIEELARRHPTERIYAAAFWQFYCDHTVISPPAFGANAESALAGERGRRYRWSPNHWRWDLLSTVVDGMMPLYNQLSDVLDGAPDAAWEAVVAAHDESIARVARSVTRAVRTRSGLFRDVALPESFVAFAVDVPADVERSKRLLRASIDEEVLPTLEGIMPREQ